MKSILVIGDIIVDNYLVGSIDRISPEAPVPIVKIDEESSVLGGAGNVINNLLAFGAKADIISVVGDNENFSIIDKLLKDKNISTNHLIREKNRTLTIKTRVLSSNQQIVRYDKEDIKEISNSTSDKIIELFENIIKKYDIVILSDYGKGVLTEKVTKNIIKTANKLNIKTLVDPKGYNYTKYTGAYLLTPNKKEAGIVTSLDIDNKNLETAIRKLKSDYNLSISIITLSHEGIALYNKELKTFPTKTKEVYDVTGAGDTVIAAIAFKLAHQQTIEEAIEFANLAAGIVVGKIGVATASVDEIHAQQYNVKTKNEIINIVSQLKKQSKKIVFTNGCFDILHLGHIKYLEKAKIAGDILIVGINSDESVKKLKGIDRPINSESDRSYLINSLKSVDYTVIFNEDTPYELIKIIKPDVLVKGGDYNNKEVVGSDIVKTTKLIDFIEGKSTTELINKIKK
ncbi:D-glycero-beta-D-manno-heptose-7-phosphate kinase [uncultured Tenacibaculum sp.]|uniref:D-glycero-beta-D-manno-heptose-7-phosphate kinase n=1 Tax=uncultured Tenacibaculum sp. TaxID=174713 RepID=UPI00261EB9DB|nr:D-glycero-beta-D-manno-heptose-7-phosphate kinase [uncultured Tenacibaculum sp.]